MVDITHAILFPRFYKPRYFIRFIKVLHFQTYFYTFNRNLIKKYNSSSHMKIVIFVFINFGFDAEDEIGIVFHNRVTFNRRYHSFC